MREPKKHIDYQRRMQLALTLAFAVILISVILLFSAGCAPKDSSKQFSKPKYTISDKQGRPGVNQRWWSKGWFWQPISKRRKVAH